MQALEMLKYVKVCKQPFDFLWGLGQLKNLGNLTLDFEVDPDTKYTDVVQEECNKAVVSSLCKLGTQNLRSLAIRDGSSLLQEPLCMHTLEKLITVFSAVPLVPKWVSSLKNLRQLHLEVEGVKQDDLCILGALPALLILHVMEATEPNESLRISGDIGFQFLRNFGYDANFEPVDLMFAAGSMPKLEKLELISFHIISAESVDFGVENLPCISFVNCQLDGDDAIVEAVKAAIVRATSTHPNHPTLLFQS